MLQLSKLFNLVKNLPVANELEDKLHNELDHQKHRFNDRLKTRGYNLDDPRVEKARIAHAVSLYKEMSHGLNVCAKELENQLKDSDGGNKELQEKLLSLQKQIGQISQKMGAYAQAMQQDQKVQEKELATQKELEKRYVELERKKDKEKELEKEQEKAKQWDKLLGMLLPASWHESWKQKTQERLESLHAELGEDKEKTPKQPTQDSTKVIDSKAVEVPDFFKNVSVSVDSSIDTPQVPTTFSALERKRREAREFVPPKLG